MASLKDLVISVTGAASGIGLEVAKLAASQGARLSLADIQEEKLEEVVSKLQSLGTEVIGTRMNVASSKEVDDWISATVKHFGRLDGAANVAGLVRNKTSTPSNLVDMTDEDWDFVLRINLTGLMYCNRAQLRVMQKGASIVNCASVVGMMGQPRLCAYSVSKHGVIGLTKTLAKEVASSGIRVNAVAPGAIDTPMARGTPLSDGERSSTHIPIGRAGQASEVATIFVFLLSQEASYMTGGVYLVDGGLMA